MASVVAVNSGGLDSAILIAMLSCDGHEVHSVYFDTRQVNGEKTELAAKTTADRWCASHKVIRIDLGQTSNYWEAPEGWVGDTTNGEVIMYDTVENPREKYAELPFQYFRVMPNLSMVINSLAIAYAKTIGVWDVYSGHKISVGQADYLENYNSMMESNQNPFKRPQLHIPFAYSERYLDEIGELYGLPLTEAKMNAFREGFSHTHSCRWDIPCGICEKCIERESLGLDS